MAPLSLALVPFADAGGFDGSGAPSAPDGSSVRDGPSGFSARFPDSATLGLQAIAIDRPLIERVTDGAEVMDTALVDDLFGVSVQALVPLGSTAAVGVDLPVWLGSGGDSAGGPTPGDWTVTAPVRLLPRGPLRALLIPELSVPTGASARWLGEPGLQAGLTASGGVDAGPLVVGLDLTGRYGGATGDPDWPGGLSGAFVADLGLAPSDRFAAHLEWFGGAPVGRPLPGLPSELAASVRIHPSPRLGWVATGGSAVSRGVGAARLRVGVGVRAILGRGADPSPVADAEPAVSELFVVDERRWPVRGATVLVDGIAVETDGDGRAVLPKRTRKLTELTVSAPGFEPATLALAPEGTRWDVVLSRPPVPVSVSVVGPEGPLADERIAVEGEGDVPPPTMDDAGVRTWALRPGTWTVTASAPGLGTQRRTLVVEPARDRPIRVDLVLAPMTDPETSLTVRVVDGHGVPVEDARIAVDGRELGTTGTGGDLVVEGLARGSAALSIRSGRGGQTTHLEAVLAPEPTVVDAVLEWPAGAVWLTVRDRADRPVDARVAFSGPAPLPSRALGTDGEELFVLRPGPWSLLVSTAELGAQERSVVVGDTPGEVVELRVVLVGAEAGDADLALRVTDLDGRPVEGATVLLDGEPLGRTGPDGGLAAIGLLAGPRLLEVEGELLVPTTAEIELLSGLQREELVVGSVTGVVELTAHDGAGSPVDARVAFLGPSSMPSLALGPDGAARTVLPPGRWDLAVSHPDLGTQTRSLLVSDGDRRRHRLEVALVPASEDLASLSLEVHDPTGAPVDAEVSVDGDRVGTTSGGQLQVGGLLAGAADLVVAAEAMKDDRRTTELVGDTSLSIGLDWAAGAVDVVVDSPGGPVDGALVAFAGASHVPPRVTVGGSVRLVLPEGRWWVMASHPDFAVTEQALDVGPTRTVARLALTEVGPSEGPTILLVEDAEGRPVRGVEVRVDGVPAGTTSESGTWSLEELPEGPTIVTLSPGPGFEGVEFTVSAPGVHTVVLASAPSEVEVALSGSVGGATVRAFGPGGAVVEATPGPDGRASLRLAPGEWTVVGEAPGAAGSAAVSVSAAGSTRIELALAETGTTVVDGRVRLVHPILFDLGSAALRPDAAALLDDVARRLLVDRSAALVEIQGHTSAEGGLLFNQQLSEERALAVRTALVARGVETERLAARGYGLSRPLTDAQDELSRQANRRVELVVLEAAPSPVP